MNAEISAEIGQVAKKDPVSSNSRFQCFRLTTSQEHEVVEIRDLDGSRLRFERTPALKSFFPSCLNTRWRDEAWMC